MGNSSYRHKSLFPMHNGTKAEFLAIFKIEKVCAFSDRQCVSTNSSFIAQCCFSRIKTYI